MPKLPETFEHVFIDPHVHLREPSPTNKSEDFESGTRAALKGGAVAVYDIFNTPGHHTTTLGRGIEKQALVYMKALIPTGFYYGLQPEAGGDEVDDINEKIADIFAGLKVFLDLSTGIDKKEVDPFDFEEQFIAWGKLAPNKPIMFHLGKNNLGACIELAEKNDLILHIFHVNNPDDVEMIDVARNRDVRISCGVCTHHLVLTEDDVKQLNWFARMKPPLVSAADSEKLRHQFNTGKIQVLETDHAPHSKEMKEAANRENPDGLDDINLPRPYGVPGLEAAMPIMFYEVEEGRIDYERLREATSTNSLRLMNANLSPMTKVIWQRGKPKEFTEVDIVSKCGHSPYIGKKIVGEVVKVVIDGKLVVRGGEIIDKKPQVLWGNKDVI